MRIDSLRGEDMNLNSWKKLSVFMFFTILCYGLAVKSQKLIPTTAKVYSNKTVIIDAGHGIPDNGASSSNGISENEINLKISRKLKKLLTKTKVKVIMTRKDLNSLSNSKTNNKSDDLKKRTEIRDNNDGDLFLSIHLNHFTDPQYSGAQVFYNNSNPENKILAESVQKNLINLLDANNKRKAIVSNDIYILKNAKIPSVLVECGFLSNPGEAVRLSSEKYQEKIAIALYSGICEYFSK